MDHLDLKGRVLACSDDQRVLFCDGALVTVTGVPAGVGLSGDLVRLDATLEGRFVRLVGQVRPRRQPFGADTETGAFIQRGKLQRLRARQRCLDAIRGWFRERGALEVETPAVSACPGLDLHLDSYAVTDRSGGLFGHLITSPEYHMKRLLVGGAERCFQLARCWRAGDLGARHQPEFTMLEWYAAWSDLDGILRDTESIVRAVAAAASSPDAIALKGGSVRLTEPFERLTVRDAFARYAPDLGDPIALAALDERAYYEAISTRIEPRLGLERPVFLTRFPSCHASLARVCADDPSVCERAELYIGGVELCNAFDELTDPDEQRRRFEADQRARAACALPVYPIDEDFVAALEEGMSPCAGNALGVDRLVALCLGCEQIADVIAFPRSP